MAVRIRLKRMGRTHRPFYRVCAMDSRSPRNGKAIERLGYYDPMVSEKDARVKLNNERVAYWLSVGALPTEKVKVLIAKSVRKELTWKFRQKHLPEFPLISQPLHHRKHCLLLMSRNQRKKLQRKKQQRKKLQRKKRQRKKLQRKKKPASKTCGF